MSMNFMRTLHPWGTIDADRSRGNRCGLFQSTCRIGGTSVLAVQAHALFARLALMNSPAGDNAGNAKTAPHF
jgi:hypothetical protein